MASTPVPLAKLSRPNVFSALPRERLFAALDLQRRHPAVWVSGPPGAGKTTLVASYLHARKLACLWYRVDAGDADPASFFAYLVQGAPPPRGPRREPLRLLTPEYLADLPGFTRRFFRVLYDRLPANAVLVLDNFQEAASASPLNAIVRDALAEVREGVNMIVISRSDPGAPFARAQADSLIGAIGWNELRLTAAETGAIAAADLDIDATTLRLLQRQSDGWVAGLVLMLQRLKQTGSLELDAPGATMEIVFAYFAGQVFDRVEAATRELLMRTAFLPRITVAAARSLTGNDEAAAQLDQLHRQRLFTDRNDGRVVSYQYHALFREFLASRIDAVCDADEKRRLKTDSASLLESSGDVADALQLHVDNEDWPSATSLILKQARGLIAEGRWLTLKAWAAMLPPEHVAQTPWLVLWLASSLILVDPPKARTMLERAFDRFVAVDDRLGQALVAAGAIESHNIEFSDFAPLDRWISVLETLLRQGLPFPSPTTSLRVHAALMLATMLRQPSHPSLPGCLQQVLAVFDQDVALTVKADTATQLLEYYDITGDLQGAIDLVARVSPLFARDDLSPFRRAGWLVFFGFHSALVGTNREGFAGFDTLRAIARDYGMTWFAFFDVFFGALMHLLGPSPLAAAPLVPQLARLVRPRRPAEQADYHLARVLLYQAQAEASLAIYHAQLCLDAARSTGGALFNVLFPTVVASAFVEAGQPERALTLVAEARAIATGTPYRYHEALMLMVEAYARSAQGDEPAACALLVQAMTRSRDDRTSQSFRWLVVGFRRMLAMALRTQTEPEQACELIARFEIAAESPDVEPWPWPIRIRTLGGFSLAVDGAPLAAKRKAQKKPLEMLKFVIAQGGREVSATTLEAALWPDAEGGAEAFEVTLRRLRKLLGNDEAVSLVDGKLALNAGLCWVDIWAFERAQSSAESSPGRPADAGDTARVDALCRRAFELYPGHFLAGDDEKPWLLGCRQRLASKYLRHVGICGQRWEEQGEPGRAERAYIAALELDPLAEPIYRRLIRLQTNAGRRAEALETYRRCRHLLSVVLGMAPSAETEAARRDLVDGV